MGKKVVIAGGTGLIGRSVCRLLLGRGYDPVVLTRRPREAERLLGDGARGVGWDGRAGGAWMDEVDGASAVINLTGSSIAQGRWTPQVRERIMASRTGPAAALVEALSSARSRPAVLVQGSAAGYYGDTGEEAASENSSAGEGFLAGVVTRWEEAAAPAAGLGVRLVLARSAVVLAGDAPVVRRLSLPVRLFAGGPLGSGRQWMSWIHIDDEAGAIVFLMENEGAEGPFNLSSPAPVRNADLMRGICRVLRRPFWLPAPAFALRAAMGAMADELILSSSRVVPGRLMEAGYRFRYADISMALEEVFGRAG